MTPAPSTKASSYVAESVPQGWYSLTGRVTGADMRLPSASQVVLSLEDQAAPGTSLLQVKFASSRLPVSYQMYFNSAKLKPNHTYGVRAKVFDGNGQTLYMSPVTSLPKTSAGQLDLAVKALP